MSFTAAIFDLDGTLLDTLAEIADSMNGVLARIGHPIHDLQAYRYLTGDGVVALITNALPSDDRDEATLRRAGELLREEYLKNWGRKAKPYDGIPELLDALAAKRVSLNVLSNKMNEFTRMAVEQFLGRWTFDQVVGESPKFPRKPDPASALHIAERLGRPPSEVAYLGDTRTDMETAAAAGMYPVGALWGFRDKDELLASGARSVIATPLEFLSFFG
jgi:phosphoglycolate phosphatase